MSPKATFPRDVLNVLTTRRRLGLLSSRPQYIQRYLADLFGSQRDEKVRIERIRPACLCRLQ